MKSIDVVGNDQISNHHITSCLRLVATSTMSCIENEEMKLTEKLQTFTCWNIWNLIFHIWFFIKDLTFIFGHTYIFMQWGSIEQNILIL